MLTMHFAFSLAALVAPTSQAKQFTYWLYGHLKHLHVLAAEIYNNAMTRKG
jgi:hypothetical protein